MVVLFRITVWSFLKILYPFSSVLFEFCLFSLLPFSLLSLILLSQWAVPRFQKLHVLPSMPSIPPEGLIFLPFLSVGSHNVVSIDKQRFFLRSPAIFRLLFRLEI